MEKVRKEHPIIFSGPMVRAILNRRKTQTRRVIKPQIEPLGDNGWQWNGHTPRNKKKHGACATNGVGEDYDEIKRFFSIFMAKSCPYGVPGHRLWIKETHYLYGIWVENGKTKTGRQKWEFKRLKDECRYFDNPPTTVYSFSKAEGWYKRPSIFMKRQDSRITLEIINVRAERVQDISEEDALWEGTPGAWVENGDGDTEARYSGYHENTNQCHTFFFEKLWDSINGTETWKKNPWVWVIDFEEIK